MCIQKKLDKYIKSWLCHNRYIWCE